LGFVGSFKTQGNAGYIFLIDDQNKSCKIQAFIFRPDFYGFNLDTVKLFYLSCVLWNKTMVSLLF